MRDFRYTDKWKTLLTPDIVTLLTTNHEYRGEQEKYKDVQSDIFEQLVEIAKIQSAEASNRIEGIYTSDERLNKIVKDKTIPQNRDEREIAGYRDVLNTIHSNHADIPIKSSIILQLHRDLYKYEGYEIGGKYKSSDNIIEELDSEGNRTVRFVPVEAWETPEAIEELCKVFDDALNKEHIDALLLIPMFILDFLCIHPFNDGNGRMSRLLMLLLLYRSGYNVGQYVSLEKMIEKTKEEYYETLQESSLYWHEGRNNYEPFVKYILGIIAAAYKELSYRIDTLVMKKASKPEQISEVIRETLGQITKAEIMKKCPGISQITIQRTLGDLIKENKIIKIGGGRYTSYIWNREDE